MTRLFIPRPLAPAAQVDLTPEQSHYLFHVLRYQPGQMIKIFNGQDGEWQATIADLKKNKGTLTLGERLRPQTTLTPVRLAFAPLKHEALLYLIEKTTEMGVTALQPVTTERCNIHRINVEKIERNTIEAAQQCERLCLPTIHPLMSLRQLLNDWPANETLIVCRERQAAKALKTVLANCAATAIMFLIGPEGGFSDDELKLLEKQPFVEFCHLGPRILRAETAALAALTGFQLLKGDWQDP